MAGRKRTASRANATNATASRSSRSTRSSARKSDVPDIYNQMLADAEVRSHATPSERPLKRRKPGQKDDRSPKKPDPPKVTPMPENTDDEDDIEFEDVPLPVATVQTVFRDSDDEEEDDEIQFEDVDFSNLPPSLDATEEGNKDLELNISARMAASPRKSVDRRKPISKEERGRRVEIHKMHLLCLLAHVARRNRWCNDEIVQKTLRKLLTDKMVTYLNPSTKFSQFGRANSLKEGLQRVGTMFKTKYQITERGVRRALWAENEEHLQNYKLPDDIETTTEKDDFREAAKSLCGSRDVGAQLYCALLRSAGVEARLVCSLQPLAFTPGGPLLGKSPKARAKLSIVERYAQQSKKESVPESPTDSSSSVLRRLGHPNAAAFHLPTIPTAPSPREARPVHKAIKESPYPIYWVEILDEAHQKWQPTDPLVTSSFWKPQNMEPPASDRENSMTYVVAFEDDGTVKDVTRRYAKAYNAKTRKMRVESAEPAGESWWQKTLRTFSRGFPTDLDQIEDNELTDKQLREPMPRNIADFKDHPVYVLKRHLRRNEVLVPNAPASGTIGAGSTGPLEKIYRHKDLRIAHSKEKWYRMGREVLQNEIPAKFLPKRKKPKSDLFNDEEEDNDPNEPNGIPIYTFDQTKQFKHPPVVNGRVPKNRFKNIDLYVPSMVPEGGAYVADELGARAAFILGVDYAPALTGFQFKGRQGTAVLHGVVVAAEAEEAVRAVIDGMKDQAAELERDRRAQVALKTWRLFLMSLRVRQRIFADVNSEDEGDNQEYTSLDKGKGIAHENDSEDEVKQDDDNDEGGGFMVDDEYAGGFMLD